MNDERIKIITESGSEYEVPNRWELLNRELFTYLCKILCDLYGGLISFDELRFLFVCKALNLNPKKIKKESAYENLMVIASQIDFIMKDGSLIPPVFLEQKIPDISLDFKTYKGYSINTDFDTFTSSLTALQYIEAYSLLGTPEKLPLLVAILYCPENEYGEYESETAHLLANKFRKLDPALLQAVYLNFVAVCQYIFTKTAFFVLRGEKNSSAGLFGIGMDDALYNLCVDGLGNSSEVEELSLVKYLSILRKKTIEAVKAMRKHEMDVVEIAENTGLSLNIIKQIIDEK